MAEALLEHLAFVERRIEEGEVHIQRQREIIAGLERAGLDTAAARDLLGVYEQTLSEHLAELERLRHELTTGVTQSVP
jgi:hypothetical protein